MANLDKSNVVNGNTISASDISALYDALTGDVTYDNINLQGTSSHADTAYSAILASSATLAISASNITTAVTGGGTHYLTFVPGAGTKAPKIASLLEYTPSNNTLQVTASYATTVQTAPSPIKQYVGVGQGIDTSLGSYEMYSFTGMTDAFPTGAPNQQHVTMSDAFPTTPPATGLGLDLWVTVTPIAADVNITQPIYVSYDPGTKVLYFETQDPGFNGQILYSGYVKQ